MKSTGRSRKIFHFAEYAVLRMLSVFLGMIPERLIYAIARIIGMFSWHCLRIRRNVTMTNLLHALGNESSEEELEKIAREAYINIGMTFIEALLLPKLKKRILEIVDMSDAGLMTRIIEKGRGLIIISCHFGSWELNGTSIAALGIPFTVVVKSQSNPYVDSYINRNREMIGMDVISRGASTKKIVRALRERGIVALISDQDAGNKGVFVSFFGRMASTPRGAAQLALKYETPMIVSMTKRTCPGRYKSIFKEVEIRDTDTVETLTQRFTTIMEDIIRQNPEQYFWMHRRWKTCPPSNTFDSAESVSPGIGAEFPSGGA
ncbi:MAG: lysophospholipid acyltransferase family protein [Candidatus Latescibacteria bacterium]|nr:lysophospholipid acyltransferase family protein [Candidatus Latescibacterota bacterium]